MKSGGFALVVSHKHSMTYASHLRSHWWRDNMVFALWCTTSLDWDVISHVGVSCSTPMSLRPWMCLWRKSLSYEVHIQYVCAYNCLIAYQACRWWIYNIWCRSTIVPTEGECEPTIWWIGCMIASTTRMCTPMTSSCIYTCGMVWYTYERFTQPWYGVRSYYVLPHLWMAGLQCMGWSYLYGVRLWHHPNSHMCHCIVAQLRHYPDSHLRHGRVAWLQQYPDAHLCTWGPMCPQHGLVLASAPHAGIVHAHF